MDLFPAEFGERVRFLRRARDLTQQDLAESMGVDISTISRLERGVQPVSVYRLPALARALGVEIPDLFATT